MFEDVSEAKHAALMSIEDFEGEAAALASSLASEEHAYWFYMPDPDDIGYVVISARDRSKGEIGLELIDYAQAQSRAKKRGFFIDGALTEVMVAGEFSVDSIRRWVSRVLDDADKMTIKHWFPDLEAADCAWRLAHPNPRPGDQHDRIMWKAGYAQAYRDFVASDRELST